jgi:hypothetical protein
MIANSVKFKGHRCFKEHWAGFDCIKPINVIIGRNNTGKSRLLDLVASLTATRLEPKPWRVVCEGVLDEVLLKRVFSPDTAGGDLTRNHWKGHGSLFLNEAVTWEINEKGEVTSVTLKDSSKISFGLAPTDGLDLLVIARQSRLEKACKHAEFPLAGKRLFSLHAERDILPEIKDAGLTLDGDGRGAANIVRWHLNSASASSRRDLIRKGLLTALNLVFRGDGQFTEISVQEYDKTEGGQPREGSWELVLTETNKGQIPLSQSGSGLKTVLLVLLNLLVVPKTVGINGDACVFAFEELENNLHPSLLRRLFRFIENHVSKEHSTVFLTTHSSVALDVFGPAENAQIIHVTHDGLSAKTATVSAHFDRQSVITELGAKPSDLLQANGVIWVEGPSDRIYINRWIELAADGKFREGRDYQCAFFGGSLLADQQFVAPDAGDSDLANLLRLNSNVIVVCDSDCTAESGEGAALKKRVARIKEEISKIPGGHIWITAAKEIENYLPIAAIQKVFEGTTDEPGQFDFIFPSAAAGDSGSFWERSVKKKSYDKVELASNIAPHLTRADMERRFDWRPQMSEVVTRICKWNA